MPVNTLMIAFVNYTPDPYHWLCNYMIIFAGPRQIIDSAGTCSINSNIFEQIHQLQVAILEFLYDFKFLYKYFIIQ